MDGDSDNCGELGDNDQGGVLQPLAEEGNEDPVGNWSSDSIEKGHVGVLGEGQTILYLPKQEEDCARANVEELLKTEKANQCHNPDMWSILAGAEKTFEDSQNLLDEVNLENWGKLVKMESKIVNSLSWFSSFGFCCFSLTAMAT